jgi:hypothetical protein
LAHAYEVGGECRCNAHFFASGARPKLATPHYNSSNLSYFFPLTQVIGFVDKVELDSSGATYFTVQCAKDGNAWTVQKRYSQFYGFEQDIKTQVAINAPFPGKLSKITSLTMAQKEERRLGINK